MPVTPHSARPEHLPDFDSPPLNEVVMGVQFSTPVGYQQIRAGEVWNLFKKDYPTVQEQQALMPSFETFGLPFQQTAIPPITFSNGATHDRFWFLRPDGAELVQFQQDRLMHNWRKVGDGTNRYPRFEVMISKFKNELAQLQDYMGALSRQPLSINQCEIIYINHIRLNRSEGEKFSDWLSYISFGENEPEDFVFNFRKILRDEKDRPIGRFYAESALGYLPDGKEVISLTLSVKGAPSGADVESALNFIAKGREEIVCRFAELTTDKAHKKWERLK